MIPITSNITFYGPSVRHFSLLSKTVINEIMQISVKYSCPIGYGIISCINKKQAIIRSSGKKNKGAEATKAAISILKNI